MTTIHNKYKEPFDVYIGCPTVFGNPFEIGKDGTREEVVAKYRSWFYDQISKNHVFKNLILPLKC